VLYMCTNVQLYSYTAAQCIVIGPACLFEGWCVCLWMGGYVTTITWNCVHWSSPNCICR